jgi:hypothetical protein
LAFSSAHIPGGDMSQEQSTFYEDNTIYKHFKPFFDLGENIFDFANQSINDLKTCKMDDSLKSHLRRVFTLLFNSSFKTFRSILFLCNKGHGEDAMTLTRTIFDIYVTLKYIQMNPEDRIYKFMNYNLLENKFRLDEVKRQNSKMSLEIKRLYLEREEEILENYNKIKGFYVKEGDNEERALKKFKSGRWAEINRREMAKKVGLEDNYNCIFPFTSCFVHPHPLGLSGFYKESDSESSFRPGASMNGIFLALPTAMRYFLFILREWTDIFGLVKAEEIDTLLNQTTTLENNYLKIVRDVKRTMKEYNLKFDHDFFDEI